MMGEKRESLQRQEEVDNEENNDRGRPPPNSFLKIFLRVDSASAFVSPLDSVFIQYVVEDSCVMLEQEGRDAAAASVGGVVNDVDLIVPPPDGSYLLHWGSSRVTIISRFVSSAANLSFNCMKRWCCSGVSRINQLATRLTSIVAKLSERKIFDGGRTPFASNLKRFSRKNI